MLRSAVQILLLCATVLLWGTASGRADVFVAGEAPESSWSGSCKLSQEDKHSHDALAGLIATYSLEFVRAIEALTDHRPTCASAHYGDALQLRGPPQG